MVNCIEWLMELFIEHMVAVLVATFGCLRLSLLYCYKHGISATQVLKAQGAW